MQDESLVSRDKILVSRDESLVSRDEILVSQEGGNLLLSGTVAPFENILVESNVLILRRRAAGAACETLLCYPFLYFNNLIFVCHTVGLW